MLSKTLRWKNLFISSVLLLIPGITLLAVQKDTENNDVLGLSKGSGYSDVVFGKFYLK